MRRITLVLLTMALLGVACSGETDDPTNRPALPATTTSLGDASTSTVPGDAPTTTAGAPGSTIDTEFAGEADERFCALAGQYIDSFTTDAPPGDVQGFGESLRQSRDLVNQMQEAAPEELVDDVVLLAQVLGGVVDALEAVDYDLAEVSPDALMTLQDPDFQAAAVRLQAYSETVCQ